MNSFSAIILGCYIKVKRVLISLKAIFEKSLQHKIYSSYTHLGGSLVWHFSFKALLHGEQLRRRIFKNELMLNEKSIQRGANWLLKMNLSALSAPINLIALNGTPVWDNSDIPRNFFISHLIYKKK